jgi:rubrerythrin
MIDMDQKRFSQIIKTAIDREVEAYTFYNTVSEKVKDKNLKKLFDELASDEKKHREMLQGLMTKDAKQIHFSAAKDYKVSDTLASPPLSPDLKPLDGLVLAIRKELDAMQMYSRLAGTAADMAEKSLFTELANMESGHKARLEDIYVNMAFPEAF